MKPGFYTPGKMLITPTGKIGRCRVFVPPFADETGCPCYLNPDPDAWDSDMIYQWGDAVSHNGKLWYSRLLVPNQGNEPGVDFGWTIYEVGTCANEDWNSIPPFGGIGKTPLYYGISVDISGVRSWMGWGGYPWYETAARFRAYFRAISYGGCYWHADPTITPYDDIKYQLEYSGEGEAAHGPWNEEGVLDKDDLNYGLYLKFNCGSSGSDSTFGMMFSIKQNLCIGHYGDIHCYELPFYEKQIFIPDQPNCALQKIVNWSADWSGIDETHTASGRISWRPLDCNYELWDKNKIYGVDACVAWEGRFYKSCQSNNQGHPPEEDASNVCEVGYWWRIV